MYIGITDEEVLQDYQAVLGPDAIIAGPGAVRVREGALVESEIRWLREHYFQTELELGRCLRLPPSQQGWQREVERHQCTIQRLERLLLDLGEPIDGPEASG